MNIAYVAGLFDGEGCVSIRKATDKSSKRGFTYSLLIDISQKRPLVLYALCKDYGGKVMNGHNGTYRWQLYSANASKFLKGILPYLIVKKEQAELAIEFQKIKGAPSNKISDEQFSNYQSFYKAMKLLKL